MASEPNSVTIKDVWQAQRVAAVEFSPAQLRQKSKALRTTVQWRNLREDLGAIFVVVVFGYYFWKFPTPLLRLGSALTAAGAFYVIYQLHTRGSAHSIPVEMGADSCSDFHKKELERQRNLLQTVWSWYLFPFVPGLFVFLLGIAVAQANAFPAHVGAAILLFAISIACVCLVFFAIWKLNQSAAQKLQLQINALAVMQDRPE